jgi:hypothetical protein
MQNKIKERFLSKVNKTDSCWLWIGCKKNVSTGYGAFSFEGKKMLAHRVSYLLFKGELTTGILVCHTCDNPSCVNPKHLFLGTHKDNSVDAFQKGRVKMPKGAEFQSGENHRYAKLDDNQVDEIREKYKTQKISLRKLGKEYKVDHSTIWQIVRGIRRKTDI